MYLKDQKYMAALAGEGSLTRAARRLNLSQPALSKWLLDLEQEIGMPLVIRSRNGLVFTEAGQIYLEGCRECLEAALEIRRELDALSQKSKQSIILGGSPIRGAQAFAKIYSEFRRKYPDIDLQFVSDKNPVLKKMLSEGEITMSLLGAMETSLPNLEYLKFMDEELLVMLPKGHSLSYDYKTLPPNQPYPAMDLANLAGTPILTTASETSYGDMVLT
ncbi:LysR family transcriptional regulator, partial [Enterocloster citroniae]